MSVVSEILTFFWGLFYESNNSMLTEHHLTSRGGGIFATASKVFVASSNFPNSLLV